MARKKGSKNKDKSEVMIEKFLMRTKKELLNFVKQLQKSKKEK